MLAVTINAGQVEISDVARPRIEHDSDAIVMVTTAAIGPRETDAIARAESVPIPGTQFTGIVVEVGEAVSGIDIDDLVVAACAVTGTGSSDPLLFGTDALPGGHAEYVRVPNAETVLTKTTPAAEERTVFAGEQAALGMRAAQSALEIAGDQRVVVTGCDAAGLTAVAWLRYRRGRKSDILAADPNEARLAAAKSLGAREFELENIDQLNAAAIISGSVTVSSETGTPVFRASLSRENPPLMEEVKRVEMAIRLRQLDLTPLVSTVLPLDEAVEAYRIAVEQPAGARSVLLKP